jgi:hypothetical protein
MLQPHWFWVQAQFLLLNFSLIPRNVIGYKTHPPYGNASQSVNSHTRIDRILSAAPSMRHSRTAILRNSNGRDWPCVPRQQQFLIRSESCPHFHFDQMVCAASKRSSGTRCLQTTEDQRSVSRALNSSRLVPTGTSTKPSGWRRSWTGAANTTLSVGQMGRQHDPDASKCRTSCGPLR